MRPWLKSLLRKIGALRLPGYRRIPIGSMASIFWEVVSHPTFTLKAGAMAFSFFFALFPGLLFVATVISYLPFSEFEKLLERELGTLLPPMLYQLVHDIVFEEVFQRQNITLLSTSLILALYSTWQGVLTLLRAFYQEDVPWQPFWVIWLKALGLLFFIVLVMASGLLFAFIRDSHLSALIRPLMNWPIRWGLEWLFGLFKSLVLFFIMASSIEVIYRAALPARSMPYWLSPGAISATILMGIATKLLSWYFLAVANFSRFYGSIAAVIALMVFFYWLSMMLLVGFAINYSFYRSHLTQQNKP